MKKFAVIVAGGHGLRLGGSTPKQFLPIQGRPLLFYTIEKFEGIADETILVLPPSHVEYWNEICKQYNFIVKVKVVTGGENRTASVMNGLFSLNGEGIVAIHDAVRPLVTRKLVDKLFSAASMQGNAVPVIHIKESMRQNVSGSNQAVNRSEFVAVQTPQCFDLQKLIKAYQLAGEKSFTDDACVFEQAGERIFLHEGETTNIKITFPEDLAIAEALLKATIV